MIEGVETERSRLRTFIERTGVVLGVAVCATLAFFSLVFILSVVKLAWSIAP